MSTLDGHRPHGRSHVGLGDLDDARRGLHDADAHGVRHLALDGLPGRLGVQHHRAVEQPVR